VFAVLFAIIAVVATLFSYYVRLETIKDTYKNEVAIIRELEWEMLVSVLNENYDKAEMTSNLIRERVVNDIAKSYAGKETELEYDLDHPDSKKPLYYIIHSNIRGVYLNKSSDANDPFVFTKDGIIGDLSLDCSPGSVEVAFRSWDQEYAQTYNKDLAKSAVFSMLTRAPVRVFWEFSKPDNPNEHAYISPMSLAALKTVYMNEGLEGLKTYEFIAYTAIFDDGDLVGRKLKPGIGIQNSKSKIIYVAQGFNLVDAVNKNHTGSLAKAVELKKFVDKEAAIETKDATTSLISVLLVIASALAGMYVSRLINEKG
jgi:hypothetical protein